MHRKIKEKTLVKFKFLKKNKYNLTKKKQINHEDMIYKVKIERA